MALTGGMLGPQHIHGAVEELLGRTPSGRMQPLMTRTGSLTCLNSKTSSFNAASFVALAAGVEFDDEMMMRADSQILSRTVSLVNGMDPSLISAADIAKMEGSDLVQGLTSRRATEILERDGPNELDRLKPPGLCLLFVLQLVSFIIMLLITAAFMSVVVSVLTSTDASDQKNYITAYAIMILVILNAGIAALTEYQAGGALEALANMSQVKAFVVRDGGEKQVNTVDLVRGDLVILNTGDIVPGDMRISQAEDLKVTEMALTGEPEDVSKTSKTLNIMSPGDEKKHTPSNMVFSGCSVTSGRGRGIVVDTGMGTRLGQIAALMQRHEPAEESGCLPAVKSNPTPLQEKVEKLGAKIAILALVICFVVFAVGILNEVSHPDYPSSWMYMILVSVTLAVAAIPEGIPLCVTISLALGCMQMVDKNVLVRKIAAVETLGSASVICSDKTGTLTEGKMTMTKLWAGGIEYDLHGVGFDPTIGGIARKGSKSFEAGEELAPRTAILASVLCCNATLGKVWSDERKQEIWQPKGNSSEAPLVVAARKLGFDEAKLVDEYPRVLQVPFSSSRKMMLTVHDVQGRSHLCLGGMPLPDGTKFLAVVKGAPNYLFRLVNRVLLENGDVTSLSEEYQRQIEGIVDTYSSEALRVLAVACRPMQELPFDPHNEEIDSDVKFKACLQDLQLLGLMASIDKEREGVKDAVLDARGAGIRVVMITGDYLKTAVAIARKVMILLPDDEEAEDAIDCQQLRPYFGKRHAYLEDESFDRLTRRVRVFARAQPEDKLQIVRSLQRQGLCVSMTGDGVNDAPALMQADIGVAMGIQGTEVAKEAAKMVLLDDNFVSIVAAVEKGRAIYAGIQKFIAFIMSVHAAEVLQIFVCIVFGIPLMRGPLQILFLILVTDLPPAVAMGMQPGDKSLLKMMPRPRSEPVVLGFMWTGIWINGAILAGVICAVYVQALMEYNDGMYLATDLEGVCAAVTSEVMCIKPCTWDAESAACGGEPRGVVRARTVAFISLVFCEGSLAYIKSSFDRPVWQTFNGNKNMHIAISLAWAALFVAVLVPFISSDILQLDGLDIGTPATCEASKQCTGWHGWLMALEGPLACFVLCEVAKLFTAYQMRRHQQELARTSSLEDKAHWYRHSSVETTQTQDKHQSGGPGGGTELADLAQSLRG